MPDKPKFPGPGETGGKLIKPKDGIYPVGDRSAFDEIFDGDEITAKPTKKPHTLRRYEDEARKLLGLDVHWELLTKDEQQRLLGSRERVTAYNNIDTNTNPRNPKIKEKQGIVAQIVRENLLSSEALRLMPTIYLGSGLDVDYPLALGARHIVLVDPIFDDQRAKESLAQRLTVILNKPVSLENGTNSMTCDFGNGVETLDLEIVPQYFYQEDMRFERPGDAYVLPERAGMIITFASQGPGGAIAQDAAFASHLAPSGALLSDRNLIKYSENPTEEPKVVVLGKEDEK